MGIVRIAGWAGVRFLATHPARMMFCRCDAVFVFCSLARCFSRRCTAPLSTPFSIEAR
jgi:hypothetical protein